MQKNAMVMPELGPSRQSTEVEGGTVLLSRSLSTPRERPWGEEAVSICSREFWLLEGVKVCGPPAGLNRNWRWWERLFCFQWTASLYHNALAIIFWTMVSSVGFLGVIVAHTIDEGNHLQLFNHGGLNFFQNLWSILNRPCRPGCLRGLCRGSSFCCGAFVWRRRALNRTCWTFGAGSADYHSRLDHAHPLPHQG